MKILVIGYTHNKYDKRVLRTVKAFSKKHEVTYQYLTNENEKSYEEGNVRYVPVQYGSIKERKSFTGLLRKGVRGLKFDRTILNLIRTTDCDIVYFHHFLPTAPVKAFRVAKRTGRKVIFDIHEYHPESFMNFLTGVAKSLKERIVWRFFKNQMELSNRLVFVSKEIMEDVFRHIGFRRPALVVPNYASFTVIPTHKNKEIVFVGKTGRDITKEKEVLKVLAGRGIKFRVIGVDSEFFGDIPHEYTNFLPYDEMMVELSKAMFSLISFTTTGNEYYKNDMFSLPNKFFDSIAAETPVIVKNTFVSMVKNVERYGVGVVIDPNDISGSVKTILDAFENYDFYRQNVEKYKELFVWDDKKEEEFLRFIFEDS